MPYGFTTEIQSVPHALLRMGGHSSGFFNSRLVIPDDALLREAAEDLFEKYVVQSGATINVDGVVGPQTGATRLAELISQRIAEYGKGTCFSASPMKFESEGQKSMVFGEEDIDKLPGKLVLLCEDVITSGGSVGYAEDAAKNAGAKAMPFILVLVNRSGLPEVNGKKIISLISEHLPMWPPAECPLCMQGSKAIEAKGDNWAILNADY